MEEALLELQWLQNGTLSYQDLQKLSSIKEDHLRLLSHSNHTPFSSLTDIDRIVFTPFEDTKPLQNIHVNNHENENDNHDNHEKDNEIIQNYESIQILARAHTNLKKALDYYHLHTSIPHQIQMVQERRTKVSLNTSFQEWKPLEEWRVTMILQKTLLPEEMQCHVEEIHEIGQAIWEELEIHIHNCIDLSQFEGQEMQAVFTLGMDIETFCNGDYSVQEAIRQAATRRITILTSTLAEKVENEEDLQEFLNAASTLILDLAIVSTDVVHCANMLTCDPVSIFSQEFNTYLEEKIGTVAADGSLTNDNRLQIIEWIEYYNSQMAIYAIQPSHVLSRLMETILNEYFKDITKQLKEWVTEVYSRPSVIKERAGGILGTDTPHDIFRFLKNELVVATNRLFGTHLLNVSKNCLEVVVDVHCAQLETIIKSKVVSSDDYVQQLCSCINDTSTLEGLFQEIPPLTESGMGMTEQEIMSEGIDAASQRLLRGAGECCQAIATAIFDQLEEPVISLWFSPAWEKKETVVENLLITFSDFFVDFQKWISGGFFFPKIVQFCLTKTIEKYIVQMSKQKKIVDDNILFADLISKDKEHIETYFKQYLPQLKRTGIRSLADLSKALDPITRMGTLFLLPIEVLLEATTAEENNEVTRMIYQLRSDKDSFAGRKKMKGRLEFATKKLGKKIEKAATKNPFGKASSNTPENKKSVNPFGSTPNANKTVKKTLDSQDTSTKSKNPFSVLSAAKKWKKQAATSSTSVESSNPFAPPEKSRSESSETPAADPSSFVSGAKKWKKQAAARSSVPSSNPFSPAAKARVESSEPPAAARTSNNPFAKKTETSLSTTPGSENVKKSSLEDFLK